MIYPLKNHRRTDWFNNPNDGSGTRKRPYGPHSGIDLVSSDKNVYAPEGGTIEAWYYHNISGWTLKMRNGTRQHKFYHLQSNSLKTTVGKKVTQGTPLALYGNTGSGSKGAHLHWTVLDKGIKVDPESYIGKKQTMQPVKNYSPISPKDEKMQTNKEASLWDLNASSWSQFKEIKKYPAQTVIETTGTVKHKLGGVYRTVKGEGLDKGINNADLAAYTEPTVTASEPPPQPIVTPPISKQKNDTMQTPDDVVAPEVAPSPPVVKTNTTLNSTETSAGVDVKQAPKAGKSSVRLLLRNYTYAGITALVTYLSTLMGDRFGIEVSMTDQVVIAGAMMTALWAGFEYGFKRFGKGFII